MTVTKRTPFVLATILAALTMGNTRETAALRAHISPSSLREWMASDEQVALQVMEAEASFEFTHVENLNTIALSDARQAAAVSEWLLERRNPAAWGRPSRNDLWIREQQVRELADELRREGLSVNEQQLMRELLDLERRKALPSGQKEH